MVLTEEDLSTQRKLVALPFLPLHISHGLGWDQTQAFAVRGWQLTVWSVAQPDTYVLYKQTVIISLYQLVFVMETVYYVTQEVDFQKLHYQFHVAKGYRT